MTLMPPRSVLNRTRHFLIGVVLPQFALISCAAAGEVTPTACPEQPPMFMAVGTHRFAVTLEDNPTARAFVQLLPQTLDMTELNGNEKYARLPRSLPTDAARPGTIYRGDVLLYGNDTLVVFYETFHSTYSYTRIGRTADTAGLAEALGSGDQRVSFLER